MLRLRIIMIDRVIPDRTTADLPVSASRVATGIRITADLPATVFRVMETETAETDLPVLSMAIVRVPDRDRIVSAKTITEAATDCPVVPVRMDRANVVVPVQVPEEDSADVTVITEVDRIEDSYPRHLPRTLRRSVTTIREE